MITMIPLPDPAIPINTINNWNDTIKHIKSLNEKVLLFIKKNLKPFQSCAQTILARELNNDTVILRYAFYYKEDKNWIENSNTFQILKSAVPAPVLEMLEKSPKNEEVDISDFIEDELKKFKMLNQNSKEE